MTCFCVDYSLSLSRNVNTWSVFVAEAHQTITALFSFFDIQIIRCNTDPVCVCWTGGTAVVLGRIYCRVFVSYITVLFDTCSSSVCI
jgi:hypothetical protein